MDVKPCVLDVNSDLGAQYLLAMHLAGAYAYAGRGWVCDCVAKILGAEVLEVSVAKAQSGGMCGDSA